MQIILVENTTSANALTLEEVSEQFQAGLPSAQKFSLHQLCD